MTKSYTELREYTIYWQDKFDSEYSDNIDYQNAHNAFEEIRKIIINTPFHKLLLNQIKYQYIELIKKIKNYFKPKTEEIETLDYL